MNDRKRKTVRMSGRIIALVFAVLLGALFILWDTGVIDLPYLERRERKATVAPESDPPAKETEIFDYTAFARDSLKALPDTAELFEEGYTLIRQDFRQEDATLAVTRIPDGEWQIYSSLLYNAEDGALYRSSPSLQKIDNPKNLTPTEWQTASGDLLLRSPDDQTLWLFDAENGTFAPFSSDSALLFGNDALPLPPAAINEAGMPQIYRENGRFGFRVETQVGRTKQQILLPAVYPVAFPQSEGYAVAQDDAGIVHVISDAGEEVFDLTLLLPENDGTTKSMGYFYADHGLLRVRLVEQDEENNEIVRDTVVDMTGREVPLPKGYRVASLREGILVLTDGIRFGYYTPEGGWLCDPSYTGAAPFFGGLAVVQNKDGKKGLVDTAGAEILPCAFDYISRFTDGSLVLYAEGIGWRLLTEIVKPAGTHPEPPPTSSYYTKITITRGPKNTFDHDDDVIIELPPILSTVPYTTRPDNTEPTRSPS